MVNSEGIIATDTTKTSGVTSYFGSRHDLANLPFLSKAKHQSQRQHNSLVALVAISATSYKLTYYLKLTRFTWLILT